MKGTRSATDNSKGGTRIGRDDPQESALSKNEKAEKKNRNLAFAVWIILRLQNRVGVVEELFQSLERRRKMNESTCE